MYAPSSIVAVIKRARTAVILKRVAGMRDPPISVQRVPASIIANFLTRDRNALCRMRVSFIAVAFFDAVIVV